MTERGVMRTFPMPNFWLVSAWLFFFSLVLNLGHVVLDLDGQMYWLLRATVGGLLTAALIAAIIVWLVRRRSQED